MYKPEIQVFYDQEGKASLRQFSCTYPKCKKKFVSHPDYTEHAEEHECSKCGSVKNSKHTCIERKSPTSTTYRGNFKLVVSAHDGHVSEYEWNNLETQFFDTTYELINSDLHSLIVYFMTRFQSIKFSVSLDTTLKRQNSDDTLRRTFIGVYMKLSHPKFIQQRIEESKEYFDATLEVYEQNGSGWRLERVHGAIVKLTSLVVKK